MFSPVFRQIFLIFSITICKIVPLAKRSAKGSSKAKSLRFWHRKIFVSAQFFSVGIITEISAFFCKFNAYFFSNNELILRNIFNIFVSSFYAAFAVVAFSLKISKSAFTNTLFCRENVFVLRRGGVRNENADVSAIFLA